MVRKSTEALADLYLADETAWLDAMAALIRARHFGELDYGHLAEYLDDMAVRDRREVNSRLKILIAHLLKWTYQKKKRTSSWENTIGNQQDDLEDLLESSTLKCHAETTLPAIYLKAVKQAMRETKLPAKTFPKECPWTLEQVLSADVIQD